MESICPGCGASFPKGDFAPNRYGVASPECWQAFNELLAQERMNWGYPEVHRLVVDAYSVQHPQNFELQKSLGISKRFIDASVQSVPVHLIALYLALREKKPLEKISASMDQILSKGATFEPLDSPDNLGEITIADAPDMSDYDTYSAFAWNWAKKAWGAWEHVHPQVKAWIQEYLN